MGALSPYSESLADAPKPDRKSIYLHLKPPASPVSLNNNLENMSVSSIYSSLWLL